MKTSYAVLAMIAILLPSQALAEPGSLELTVTGKSPNKIIRITSPGIYRADVTQESGGGIQYFYDLAADPECKRNLTDPDRGLLEIGWHGRPFERKFEDRCCAKHMMHRGKDKNKCHSGCGDWPSRRRRRLNAQGELKVLEAGPARVRVATDTTLTWWHIFNHKHLKVHVEYTFYVTGEIAASVRIRNVGDRPFYYGREHGPHLYLMRKKLAEGKYQSFVHGTPDYLDFSKETKGMKQVPPSEELSMAHSAPGIATSFFITIPPAENKIFTRHMRHTYGHCDRFGYGCPNIDIEPGYDRTWACMIQMGTPGTALAADMKVPNDALPYAMQYRVPAKLTGVELVKDDPGDLNGDGYNESEACHVIKGPGPIEMTYSRGDGAGFAPAFKVVGWAGPAPGGEVTYEDKKVPAGEVTVDGEEMAIVADVSAGNLIIQLLGRIKADQATIRIVAPPQPTADSPWGDRVVIP